ncbi:MAG TPA: hypothetical protein VG405_01885 [Solirubrobacteraceae bacterium]|nr:hypothetical protein [Solirubrobacteraceae bacterium]
MTITAPDPNKLRELDEDTRRAWNDYRERIQTLSGEEYEQVESESWKVLQGELRRLERRRRLLSPPLPGPPA